MKNCYNSTHRHMFLLSRDMFEQGRQRQERGGSNCSHSFQNHLNPFRHSYITFTWVFVVVNIYISAFYNILPWQLKIPSIGSVKHIFKSFKDISADHLPFKRKLQSDYGGFLSLWTTILYLYIDFMSKTTIPCKGFSTSKSHQRFFLEICTFWRKRIFIVWKTHLKVCITIWDEKTAFYNFALLGVLAIYNWRGNLENLWPIVISVVQLPSSHLHILVAIIPIETSSWKILLKHQAQTVNEETARQVRRLN